MNRLETLAHYSVGAVIGALLAMGLSFMTGWVVLADSVDETIRKARVEAFAAVCVARSIAEWEKEGHELRELAGMSNPDRMALVERFIPATEAADGLESTIATVCSNVLRVQA
jgi:hypothetical protein